MVIVCYEVSIVSMEGLQLKGLLPGRGIFGGVGISRVVGGGVVTVFGGGVVTGFGGGFVLVHVPAQMTKVSPSLW